MNYISPLLINFLNFIKIQFNIFSKNIYFKKYSYTLYYENFMLNFMLIYSIIYNF